MVVEIREGLARILVPPAEWKKGPNSADVEVFYNPTMELNRDISISLLNTFSFRRVLDGLAASGIRGIRFSLETTAKEVHINDRDPKAYALIKRNIELNGVDAIAHNEDFNILTRSMGFDYVDVDPFGTPVPFLESAIMSLSRKGLLAITATDTAVLCGAYPKVCRRRYMANPAHNRCMHEAGLRILIGHAVRIAAVHDIGLRPVLAYSADHYFRAYLKVEKGATKADRALERIGKLSFDGLEPKEKEEGDHGPMWLGPIFDKEILGSMRVEEHFGTKKRMEKLLELWKSEAEMPVCFHEAPEIASHLGISVPTMDKILTGLRDAGYRASRTHFSPTGFKTDAPVEDIFSVFRQN